MTPRKDYLRKVPQLSQESLEIIKENDMNGKEISEAQEEAIQQELLICMNAVQMYRPATTDHLNRVRGLKK